MGAKKVPFSRADILRFHLEVDDVKSGFDEEIFKRGHHLQTGISDSSHTNDRRVRRDGSDKVNSLRHKRRANRYNDDESV